MKKISLRGISEILSEKELKNVIGGGSDGTSGTCGWRTTINGITWYNCGVSKEEAQYKAGMGSDGYWCCDSCSISTYC